MAAYGEFAKVYDRLMGTRASHDWPGYVHSLLQDNGILPGMKILDVGCGTGYLSLPLIEFGYRVTGLDNSPAMLEKAAHNANERGIFLPLVEADMRDLPEEGLVHAITCACDPVNYLLDESEVARFFSGAYGKLYPGGALLFDVCTPYYYQSVLSNNCFALAEANEAYILQTSCGEHRCDMLLTLFIRQKNGLYARSEEEHALTAFPFQTLLRLLDGAGFVDSIAYSFGTKEDAKDFDERWQFVARKA